MGSGKTTAGKQLAGLLGWTFVDLDKQIEIAEKMTIPEIFSMKGEDYFRLIESNLLLGTGTLRNAVISTGGGAPCSGKNMDFMLGAGITVYLKLTPGELVQRLISSKTERPLIKGLDRSGLLNFIREKLKQREKYYNRAEIIIEDFNIDVYRLKELIHPRI